LLRSGATGWHMDGIRLQKMMHYCINCVLLGYALQRNKIVSYLGSC
jgi:hypothetical protein